MPFVFLQDSLPYAFSCRSTWKSRSFPYLAFLGACSASLAAHAALPFEVSHVLSQNPISPYLLWMKSHMLHRSHKMYYGRHMALKRQEAAHAAVWT